MAALKGGTPHLTGQILTLAGERFFVAEDAQTGARTWKTTYVPAQQGDWAPEVTVDLSNFSEGYGFTWQGIDGTYSHADGWDASTPGKLSTWPVFAKGEAFTTTDGKGWMFQMGKYLYVARGRYVKKYVPTDTPGTEWAIAETHDLGSGNICTGRPGIFKGKAYVPVRQGAAGALVEFEELTTVADPPSIDTWTTGPNTRKMQCFIVFQNKMYAGTGNRIYSVAGDPTVGNDWQPTAGNGEEVGEPASEITDLGLYVNLLLVAKTNGLYSFDPTQMVVNELSDLRFVVDIDNGKGMEYTQGRMLVPWRSGLFSWVPGAFSMEGPNVEGGMDNSDTPGWGRVTGIVPFGGIAYMTVNDEAAGQGALLSIQPGIGKRPNMPHVHQLADGSYDSVMIWSSFTQPLLPSRLTTWVDDNSIGTVAWSSPQNMATNDTAWAEASGSASTTYTHYLKGTQLGAPNIPANATITGITARIRRRSLNTP